jgi:DNA-binding NtrC family response regulator
MPDHDATRTEDLDLLGQRRGRASTGGAGLVLLYAPEPERVPHLVPLSDSEPLVIGREPPAGGLPLPSGAVSRLHTRIHWADRWVLTDLDSRNGTLVNGVRVASADLAELDEIRIGDAIFKLVTSGIAGYAAHRIDRPVSSDQTVAGPRTQAILAELSAIAASDLAVLILGETGTGKELAARAVHEASGRRGRFAALNCAAVPGQIIESELFGHRRGAFTSADRDKVGLIALADGGTLFLDEVGELAPEAQAKLLRVIETGELWPLGASAPEKVHLRFVAATNRDLPRWVEAGAFRADLYARLGGHVVSLPPLRERKEDLIPLLRHFVLKHGRPATRLPAATAAALCHHDWPFNIRELESVVRRAIALLASARAPADAAIELVHLPAALLAELTDYGKPAAPAASTASGGPPDAEALRAVLAQHHGNVAAVARAMGKDRVQIHRWMRRFGLNPADFRG